RFICRCSATSPIASFQACWTVGASVSRAQRAIGRLDTRTRRSRRLGGAIGCSQAGCSPTVRTVHSWRQLRRRPRAPPDLGLRRGSSYRDVLSGGRSTRPSRRERRLGEPFAPCAPCRLRQGRPPRGRAYRRGASAHSGSFLPHGHTWTTPPRTPPRGRRCASPITRPACRRRVRLRG